MNKYAGLFDFEDPADVIPELANLFGYNKEEVINKILRELISTGYCVNQSIVKFDVTPYVFDEKMERFYNNTDAFVFECIGGHLRSDTIKVDQLFIEAVERHLGKGNGQKILFLGDGIGSDTLRFAALGYNCTYFEFESPSAQLAIHRFKRQSLDGKINSIHQLEKIPLNTYDAVICREVLEHVRDPLLVIKNINKYLKNGGVAFITESFHRLTPQFPTHLKSNLKYAGKTPDLFVKAGFTFMGAFRNKKPFIFKKSNKPYFNRRLTLRKKHVFRNFLNKRIQDLLKYIPF